MPSPIVLNNFQTGTTESPIDGIAALRNIDVDTYPGVARVNFDLALESDATVAGLTKWFVRNTNATGDIYSLDSTGTVSMSSDDGESWTVVPGNSKATAIGQGLCIWQEYLFVARDRRLDVYNLDPLEPIATRWTNDWKPTAVPAFLDPDIFESSGYKPMLVGQDEILYIGNQRFITSIQEVATKFFKPSDNTTYIYSAKALDLPGGYNIKCLAELGVNLLIGTTFGQSGVLAMDAPSDFKIADIFPWDRTSPSFDIPLRLNDNGVHCMVNKDNIVYVMAGLGGNIFATNGTTIRFVRRIPESVAQIDNTSYLYGFPGAMMVHKNRVFFGVSSDDSQANGVWSINTVTNALCFENQASTVAYNVRIGALFSVDRQRFISGWSTPGTPIPLVAAAQGIDRLNMNARNSVGIIDSQMFRVGTVINNATFSNLLVQLGKPLLTGQSVTVAWRQAGVQSVGVGYTDIYTFSTVGEQAFNAPANIENVQEVQLLVTLTTNPAGDPYTPELVEVRLE